MFALKLLRVMLGVGQAQLATRAGIEGNQRMTIHAPLMQLDKAGIIRSVVKDVNTKQHDQQVLELLKAL